MGSERSERIQMFSADSQVTEGLRRRAGHGGFSFSIDLHHRVERSGAESVLRLQAVARVQTKYHEV